MLEQRAAERNPFIAEVDYSIGGRAHKDISKDVSVSGMFIETERDLKVGDTMTVCFVMAQGNPVRTVAQVVRKTIDGVGIRFVQSLS